MTVALLAALVASIAVFAVILDRGGKRAHDETTQAQNDWSAYAVTLNQRAERDRDAHRADIEALVVRLADSEAAHRAEVADLLQRIQAPEAAVYEHATQALPPDPDGSPMTDEQMAEREERTRVLAFIERHENGVPG